MILIGVFFLAASITLFLIFRKRKGRSAALCAVVISAVYLAVCGTVSLAANTNFYAKEAEINAERNIIIYQLKKKTYLSNPYAFFRDISDFNRAVVGNRNRHHNLWTSWLFSGVWDRIETIDPNRYEDGEEVNYLFRPC